MTNPHRPAGRPAGGADRSGAHADDEYWRRPPAGSPEPPRAEPEPVPAPEYTGPPRATPPPPGWRPPVVVPTPPPREMPAQDNAALDAAEQGARTVSQEVALVAGAIVLILLFVVCARLLS